MQIVITRDNASIPWGFRLKGGAEYNVPLSILKVTEGSPSYNKLESGDVIASIGNYPALNLRHEEALNIIRMFDLSLPLVIQRQQSFAFNPTRTTTKTTVTPVLWRPPSVSSYDPRPPAVYSNENYSTSVYQPQIYNYSPPNHKQISPVVASTIPAAPTLPSANIPPPPPMPESFSSVNNYKSQQQQKAKPTADASYYDNSHSNSQAPDAILNKVLNRSPMGQKPFSYTPGGLDLSHIRESARVKRYESMNSKENNSYIQQNVYNAQPPPQPPAMTTNFTASTLSGSGSVSVLNRSNSISHDSSYTSSVRQLAQSRSVAPAPVQPVPTVSSYQPVSVPASSFSITPEQLVKPKPKEERKDLMNQSFSFKMLNKWIAESEANNIQLVSKKDEEENVIQNQRPPSLKKSEVIKALEEDEKKIRPRQSQSPQSHAQAKFNQSYTVPSKVFQYVDRKFSESDSTTLVNRKPSYSEDPAPYNPRGAPPAREREQEPPVPKYKGTHIPSKSFRYLQYLTQNESVNDDSSSLNSNSQAPVFQTASVVQIATTNKPQTDNFVAQQSQAYNSNSISFPNSSSSFNPLISTANILPANNPTSNLNAFSANLGLSSAAHIAAANNSSIQTSIEALVEDTAIHHEANIINADEANVAVENSNQEPPALASSFNVEPSTTDFSVNEIINEINLTQSVQESSMSKSSSQQQIQDNRKQLVEETKEEESENNGNQVEIEKSIEITEVNQSTSSSSSSASEQVNNNSANSSIVQAQEEIIETSEF